MTHLPNETPLYIHMYHMYTITNWTSYYKMYRLKSQTRTVGMVTSIIMVVLWICHRSCFCCCYVSQYEPLSGMGMVPNNERSNGKRRTEGGPCQQPALYSTQPKEAASPRLHALYMYLQPCHACMFFRVVHVNIFANNNRGLPAHPQTKTFHPLKMLVITDDPYKQACLAFYTLLHCREKCFSIRLCINHCIFVPIQGSNFFLVMHYSTGAKFTQALSRYMYNNWMK